MATETKQKIEINPEVWQGREDSECRHCGNKYIKQQCISLCGCGLFCHDQCFLIQFYPYLREGKLIECIVCKREIKVDATYRSEWWC